MGLYVEKDRRIYVTRFERGRDLTPLPELCAPKLYTLPPFLIRHVLAEFERRQPLQWFGESDIDARAWLETTVKKFVSRKLNVAFDIEETQLEAERLAAISRRERTVDMIERVVKFVGLKMPKGNKNSTPRTIANRCYEPKVWRRIIEVNHTRESENCLREVGFIERRSQLYCSDLALSWHRAKQRAQKSYLQSHQVTSGEGEQLNLWEVRERSVSNPALRRAELMTRMRGFEEIAKARGDVAEFITLTAPSAFHSMLSAGGPNSEYKGFTVREAQAWLAKMWARSRSRLAKLSILVYGFRVAEPHHDGTPHWHMVLFCAPRDRGLLWAVLRSQWLSEYAHERGGSSHRIKFQAIDPSKGSATGYISKYVAKNIDGYEVGRDFEADNTAGDLNVDDATAEKKAAHSPADSATTSARVRAWASIHGIRQFQQIGGPQVTVYREFRRRRDALNVVAIERARLSADAGDWHGYVDSVGGIEVGRNGAFQLWTKVTGKKNGYDELRGPQIKGIRCASGERIATHEKSWCIERVPPSSLGPVSITVRGASVSGEPSAWTNSQETSMYGPPSWIDSPESRARLADDWREDELRHQKH